MERVKPKLCFIASTGIPIFHKTNIEKLSSEFDVYAVMKIDDLSQFDDIKVKEAHSIAIERRISIFKDIRALWQLYRYLKKHRFDAFVSQASKPSLLASIAGRLAGIPVRTRIFTGQLWAHKKGFGRWFYKSIDRLTVALNTNTLVDGPSQRKYLVQNKILKDKEGVVLANGSICGVDTDKFCPQTETRTKQRSSYGIKDNDIVFSFMGRINREKGIFELLEAFNILATHHKNVKLVLIGNTEGISKEIMSKYSNIIIGENLILYGFTKEPYNALQISDVFCLPSYREGFGMSAIEASSLALPVICSDAYGLADAYIDGVTGIKCKVMDVDSLYNAMETYVKSPELIYNYGSNGRKRILEKFNKDLVSDSWLDYLRCRVNEQKIK